ncbi:FmdB family zinc ribbon protein [Flexivirga meconopsidis]|uniref:FmdB family zinc ribbon protein n=1 Tax=Flexivirga meconopsidis TaxID=2977121 RepID=UPI00223EE67E
MPTYSYACKDCGHAFDINQSFSDDALTVCPECGGQLRKKFGSVGVVFKGSGFYKTDSRDSGSKSSSTSGTSGTEKSSDTSKSTDSGSKTDSTSSTSTTKTESKPAAKSA